MNRLWRDIDIRLLAALLSVLLSLWAVLINPIPNADAFDYVRTAHVYLDDGVAAAFAWYPSATYPILMGVVHQLTGLDLFAAGQLINALFFSLLTYCFISLALLLRPTRRMALIAATVILVFPTLNELRYNVIRDIAYLALMLSAVYTLCLFARDGLLRHGLAFIGLSVLAALFRAEALVFLPLVPLFLLTLGGARAHSLRRVLILEALLLGMGVVVGGLAMALAIDVPGTLQRMVDVYLPFLRDVFAAFSDRNSPLAVAVFGEFASNFAGDYLGVFMVAGLAAMLVLILLGVLGGPALLILGYGVYTRTLPWREPVLRPVVGMAVVSFGILLAFLLLTRFMVPRYTLLFVLCGLLFVPAIIDSALERLPSLARPRLLRGTLGILLLFSSIDAHISFGDSKEYLDEAVAWLLRNSPPEAIVLTNNNYVGYHSGRVAEYDRIFRYLAEDEIEKTAPGTLIVVTTRNGIDAQIARNVTEGRIDVLARYPDNDEPMLVIARRRPY